MHNLEKTILYLIGTGKNNVKILRSEFIESEWAEIETTLKVLEKRKLLSVYNDQFRLTTLGLLSASEFGLWKNCKITHKKTDKKPYCVYRNNLKRDIIFLPFLSFDTRENINYDNNNHIIYETEIFAENLDIKTLQVIENSLFGSYFGNMGAFWIIKNTNKFCGFEVKSMMKALNEIKTSNCQMVMAFSARDCITIIRGEIKKNIIEKFHIKFYLSNCGETPYADVLDGLETKLKLFLNFLDIDVIPRGKECTIKPYKLAINEKDFHRPFVPKLLEKIFFDGNLSKIKYNLPLVVAINPENISYYPKLKKISPWFVDCCGGFSDQDFRKKSKFMLWYTESYDFPEVVILSIMLHPFYKSKLVSE